MNFKQLITFFHKLPCLLPQSCFLCGDTSTQAVCTACLADLPYHETACICCATFLEEMGICSQCQKEPPPYSHTQAIFSYTYPVNKLIQAAKFSQNIAVLNLLGNMMAQHLIIDQHPDVLIPVPLHPKRLRYRGYNQSLELAKCITKQRGIPFDYKACKRIKNTHSQATLSAEQRQSNIVGAFSVTQVEWQHIALIDDVMTTGATVGELAKVFLGVGVQRVDVWCCARR